MFVAGAEPRTPDVRAEGLRVPELRGALRFWQRATSGSLSLADLRDAGGRLFGDTHRGRTLRLVTHWLSDKASVTAHPRMNDHDPHPTIRQSIRKQAVPAETCFHLTVETYRPPSAQDAGWLRALGLLDALGGVGGRTRRGCGSLAVARLPDGYDTLADVHGWPRVLGYPPFVPSPDQNLPAHVEAHIGALLNEPRREPANGARHSILARPSARLFVITPQPTNDTPSGVWRNWTKAMDALRTGFYRPFKTHLGRSAIGEAKPRLASPLLLQIKSCAVRGKDGADQGEAIFGLALVFRHDRSDPHLRNGPHDLDNFLATLPGASRLNAQEIHPWPTGT